MPLTPPVGRPAQARDEPASQGGPTRITLVESEACHFCADALDALEELAADHDLLLEVVDIRSPAGRALVQRHRPSMSPLVLVDGTFFSHGRLPRRKLAKVLTERAAAHG